MVNGQCYKNASKVHRRLIRNQRKIDQNFSYRWKENAKYTVNNLSINLMNKLIMIQQKSLELKEWVTQYRSTYHFKKLN